MVLVLKDSKDIRKVKELLAGLPSKKKFDAKKFYGALKLNEDAVTLQRRWRDEW